MIVLVIVSTDFSELPCFSYLTEEFEHDTPFSGLTVVEIGDESFDGVT